MRPLHPASCTPACAPVRPPEAAGTQGPAGPAGPQAAAVVTVQQFQQLNAIITTPAGALFRCTGSPSSFITFREISFTVTPVKLTKGP
jgi:hypothetical protein